RLNLQRVQREGVRKSGQRLTDAISMLDSALSQVRQWSFDLRPPLLDDLGLVAALRWYVDRQVRAFVIPHLKTPRREKRFSPEIEIACFRVAQEALTNVVRHSKAKHVWIELHEDGKGLTLGIKDDGVGFDVTVAQNRAVGGGSLGLLGMQERLRLCGGSAQITSTPGSGTSVLAVVPISLARIGQNGNRRARKR
ncbi:MAG TPA: ATP-binding protein, partial [Terriglobia bacterium]|nr:ATP-binding protein [Terriglobia bacterium]